MARPDAVTVFTEHDLRPPLVRPVLLKLGGSVLTDKSQECKFRRPAAKRLLGELKRAGTPAVLFHGAGSFGHPQAKRHQIGQRTARPDGVADVLAAIGRLHADIVAVAEDCGLKPLSFPLHQTVSSAGDDLDGLPVARLRRAIEEGYMPVIAGTLVRDDVLGWRVVSADEWLAVLAPELDARLAIFCSDVDGVLGADGVLDVVAPRELGRLADIVAKADDVTGAMMGKLERAFAVAACCPTWVISGTVRGRLQDLLKGKPVVGTRIETD